jgi:erythromycin esterase-like protein
MTLPSFRRSYVATRSPVSDAVGRSLVPLRGSPADYDPLLASIGDARFVLIGEASHGTHEFYAERAALTRRLIEEKGFGAVCIEGDWPDAFRVDCFVRGRSDDASAADALAGFKRFPTWMWRNDVVRDFVDWLRDFNRRTPEPRRAGFYGLDLYSMFGSIQAVISYLNRVDPDAARRARHRYACFDHFEQDSQRYGYAAAASIVESCEQDAIRELMDLRARSADYVSRDGRRAMDDFFSAEQNARLVRNAEQYYRSMYRGRGSSWNLRDRHMAETLDGVAAHLEATGRVARIVVWAHNSHLGDARFTDMRRRGELNLGQLARERYGDAVRLIGMSTNTGTVTAAHDWDEPGRLMQVRPSLDGSYERVFTNVSARFGEPRYLLLLREDDEAARQLSEPRLQRAIGVIYRPETERQSHYYEAELTRQFDAMIHIDVTTALRALDGGASRHRDPEEPPETFPSGI